MERHDDRTGRVPPAAAGAPAPQGSSIDVTPAQDAADLATIAALAREIWTEFYVPLIGRAQVEYMLARFQTAAAIAEQLRDGYAYYVVRHEGRAVGYCAVQVQAAARTLFLSKLYLQRAARGAGAGRATLDFVERLARAHGLDSIWLTVNKRNPSLRIYETLGFRITADLCIDIGTGFVMDDHRMEKALPRAGRGSSGAS